MNKKFWKYFREYRWSNIFTMIKNNRLDPKICADRFDKKLVVITGATSGIGKVTAHKFASMGANLLCVNRNKEKSEKLCNEIINKYDVSCDYLLADLSNLEDIHRVSNDLKNLQSDIDVLIHHAGVYLPKHELNEDNLEKVFVVHYLSSFILNHILRDKLKAQKKSRIILVNSEGHRFAAWGLKLDDLNWEKRSYSGLKSYGSAKLAQLLSMLSFDEHFQNSGVTINAMHPGAVKTETGQDNGPIYRWFKRNFFDKTLKSAVISAEALYYLSVSKDVENNSGKFYNLTSEELPAPPALDMECAKELWPISLKMSGLNN